MIGGAARGLIEIGNDGAIGQAEEAVELAHPLQISPCQIVVHGDDVHALAFQRIEIHRQRGDQGLALAGAHLGNLTAMQHHAADQLHIEMPHAQHAL